MTDTTTNESDLNIVEHTGGRFTDRHDAVQRGVFAAFGTVKLDYRSPKRLDEAASIVADFVCAELDRIDGETSDKERTK